MLENNQRIKEIDADKLLKRQVMHGAKQRYPEMDNTVKKRIKEELIVISDKKLADYYLVYKDIIDFAKSSDIPIGPGRGEIVGSITAYCLGITNINPLEYDLLFEPFINSMINKPKAITINIGFSQSNKIAEYISKKFGQGDDIKLDLIEFRVLSKIKTTEKFINESSDRIFKIENIPLNDEKTFKLFEDGLTVGVFQFESSGMQEYLKKLKPSHIEDLIAMNALYRPGPIKMKIIDDFIDHKTGRKDIEYMHPKLELILHETYGIIIYHEQVIRIISELTGLNFANTELMHRAILGIKPGEITKEKEQFIKGCQENDIDENTAISLFYYIVKYAEYTFNKAHSIPSSLIGYQTAFLKVHYPEEFMTACITSEQNNQSRLMVLEEECKRLGLRIYKNRKKRIKPER